MSKVLGDHAVEHARPGSIAAFREASARLREGDRGAEFPEGTFPPGLPFVPFPSTVLVARGQPA